MSESDLQKDIRSALKERFGGKWYKIHGGPYQEAGIPDIIGCVRGLFIGLEVKLPGKERTLTQAQKHQIEEIVLLGEGAAGMVASVAEALEFVASTLSAHKISPLQNSRKMVR